MPQDLSKGDGLINKIPAALEPRHDRWETIRYALADWPRTFRLCLIIFAVVVALIFLGIVAVELILHLL